MNGKEKSGIIFMTEDENRTILNVLIVRFLLSIFGFLLVLIITTATVVNIIDDTIIIIDNDMKLALFSVAILIFVSIHAIGARYDIDRLTKKSKGFPILVSSIEEKNVSAKTDLFGKGLMPTDPYRPTVFSIYAEFKRILEPLTVCIYKTGNDRTTQNTCITINPDDVLCLDIIINPNETFNFTLDKDSVVNYPTLKGGACQ